MTLVPVAPLPTPIITASAAKARTPALASLTDAQVEALIAVATMSAQETLGRAIGVQTWDWKPDVSGWVFQDYPCYRPYWVNNGVYWAHFIELPLPPLVSVTSVSYLDSDGDTQTWAADQYRVSGIGGKGRISLADGASWPTLGAYPEALTIRFQAGYATVPEPIIQAILLEAANLSSMMSSTTGGGELRRVVIEGMGSREYHPTSSSNGTSRMSGAAQALLAPYRVFA